MDHKPRIFAIQFKSKNYSPGTYRHLDFISQFTNDITHMAVSANILADALSRIAQWLLSFPATINLVAIASDQPSLDSLDISSAQCSWCKFEYLPLPTTDGQHPLWCIHWFTQTARSWSSSSHHLRRSSFVISSRHYCYGEVYHGPILLVWYASNNPRLGALLSVVSTLQGAQGTVHCTRHSLPTLQYWSRWSLAHPFRLQIHRDLYWSVPPVAEDIPLVNITAEFVARVLTSSWIVCFSVLSGITTDRGCQFKASFSLELSRLLDAQYIYMTRQPPSIEWNGGEITNAVKGGCTSRCSKSSTVNWISFYHSPTSLIHC